jgi:hypothetical protein
MFAPHHHHCAQNTNVCTHKLTLITPNHPINTITLEIFFQSLLWTLTCANQAQAHRRPHARPSAIQLAGQKSWNEKPIYPKLLF